MAVKAEWARFRVAVVYNDRDYQVNKAFADSLVDAFNAYGVKATLLRLADDSHAQVDLSGYDIVVNRTRRTWFLKHAKPEAAIFNKPEFTVMANDKLRTSAWATLNKVKALDTRPYSFRDAGEYKYPIVVKKVDGRGGEEVFKADCAEDLDKLQLPPGDYVAQEYCPAGGVDYRAYVMFRKIVHVVAREAAPGEWRANYSINKRARRARLTLKEFIRIKRIAKMLPYGYYGIDFFRDKGKFVLNEVEDVVGARAVYQLWPRTDIAKRYVKELFRNLGKSREWERPAFGMEPEE